MQIDSAPTLATLLQGFARAPSIGISGVASDSRKLCRGNLFLATQGMNHHGLDYLDQAKNAGVAAVAWDSSSANAPADIGVPLIAVENLAAHVGEIASRFYGAPSEQMHVVGVTGTNGKTTVAWLISQCWQQLQHRCAYLGTIGYGVDELELAEGMTTPAAVDLQARLTGFVEQGATYAAMEVSSHALTQHRVDGVRFSAALFTNLTHDHLDYHGDMQSYFDAKSELFLKHGPATRIISLDTEFGAQLAERCGVDAVAVSTQFDRVANGRPYLFVRSVVETPRGSDVTFTSSWGDGRFSLALPGDFNVANAAIVLAYLLTQNVPLEMASDVLQLVQAPPGRMQRVDDSGVYVDYAHTPDALESALRALRPHTRGKLWCVFGCGGDRDIAKRPQMALVAERLADHVIVTNDNPRSEPPQEIVANIVAGFTEASSAVVIEDRAAAIAWAIDQANDSDTILVAGKGHEDYQEIGAERLPFSDLAVATAALQARVVRND
ncbi:MAG: UDP-N-acetylmuramoyl-L-alanyl-D-glutamate--2,6-diaminopimelate ligase [Gammaproteobacteria bacterium]|nr:UDP-N-acetylmuramoyl-L-alanyl-D-glutamate--2,6-diaminopimelate ligase [Gammaproteobacteria bacterium]